MWEIYAYQNADSLFGIFNAAATIHGSGDYMAAVAAVAFCGFIAALVAYAFAPEKLQGWKWLATVLLVFSVLIVPRVTVGVVDKTGGSAVKVVANVPFGVAFLGSVTSTVGHTLTGLFETAFQVIPGVGALPSELSYEKNGLMFGNRLIRETGGVAFQDPNFRTDLVNFIHNCTMYDLIDGTVDPGTFSSSDDVWALMASPNPARFTTLTSAGGSITVDTCPNAYTNLNGRLPAQLTRIQGKLAFQLNPTLPAAAANSAIAGQIQQAYLKNSIATAAATAADLIRQNAVLNAQVARGDHQFARQWLRTLLHPDLQVDVRGTEREVVAAHALDHRLADHEAVRDPVHQDVVGILVEQVAGGRDDVELRAREFEHALECVGSGHLGVDLVLRVVNRQRLAVVDEQLVDQIAGALGAQFVRPLRGHPAGVVELDLLPGLQHDLERVARICAEPLLVREEVGRGLQKPLRLGGDARGLGLRGHAARSDGHDGNGPGEIGRQRPEDCRLHAVSYSFFSRRIPSIIGCQPNTSETMKASMRRSPGPLSLMVDL